MRRVALKMALLGLGVALAGCANPDVNNFQPSAVPRLVSAKATPVGPAPEVAAQGDASTFAEQVASIQNAFWHSCGSDPAAEPVSVCQPLSILAGKAHSLLKQVQTGALSQQAAEQRLETDRDQTH
jgi:hypothetical protein